MLREEAVQSLRAVRGEAEGGASSCSVYLYTFPLCAAVATGNILNRLIIVSDVYILPVHRNPFMQF